MNPRGSSFEKGPVSTTCANRLEYASLQDTRSCASDGSRSSTAGTLCRVRERGRRDRHAVHPGAITATDRGRHAEAVSVCGNLLEPGASGPQRVESRGG